MFPGWKKFINGWTALVAALVLIAIYLSVLYPWMNGWGATGADAGLALPGDGTEANRIIASTRAITIHAPASVVWQWLVQIGQGRAGFYSNDWCENLVLADIHNIDSIHPEWQSHKQGDTIAGAGGAVYPTTPGWTLKSYAEGAMLYLWGPLAVLPVDMQTSRFYMRTYADPPNLLTKLSYDWIHFVMERGMMLGIKARAEGTVNRGLLMMVLAKIGWSVATLGMLFILFVRRRGWWVGLIPLAYGIAIVVTTRDIWSAMAGFLWWGVVAAGFVLLGHHWWSWLLLATVAVIYIFVLSPQPFIAFGIIFLIITLWIAGARLRRGKPSLIQN
jgi:hypothetical protein